jgi:hypothetical protein
MIMTGGKNPTLTPKRIILALCRAEVLEALKKEWITRIRKTTTLRRINMRVMEPRSS